MGYETNGTKYKLWACILRRSHWRAEPEYYWNGPRFYATYRTKEALRAAIRKLDKANGRPTPVQVQRVSVETYTTGMAGDIGQQVLRADFDTWLAED